MDGPVAALARLVGLKADLQLAAGAPGADPALVGRIATNASSADKDMALSAMRHVFGWYQANTPAALAALGAKLRNINADPKDDGKPRHTGVTLVAGTGHFIPQEKPAEFNQALEEIVAGFATTPGGKSNRPWPGASPHPQHVRLHRFGGAPHHPNSVAPRIDVHRTGLRNVRISAPAAQHAMPHVKRSMHLRVVSSLSRHNTQTVC